MHILAINAGSSSIKFSAYRLGDQDQLQPITSGVLEGLEPQGQPRMKWLDIDEGHHELSHEPDDNDPAYETTTAEPIIVGGGACTIHAVDANGDETTIETTATNGRSVTNFRVLVDNTNGDFLEWEEAGSL